jgi:hypothetical protein
MVNLFLNNIQIERDSTELHSMFITTKNLRIFKVAQIHHVLMMQEFQNISISPKLENNLKSPEMIHGLHAVIRLEKDII